MIPFLDLKDQHESIRAEIDDALSAVVASQSFILGPEVERLEDEVAAMIGVPHAIGCASGTDALLLTLLALDPRPEEEVIVPAFTFFATAGAVWHAGFRPVFCDVDEDSFNVTAATVEAAWSPRTRAFIPVHLYGQMAPMEELEALARERGAFVLEDAAQAIGARQRRGASGGDGTGGWIMAGSVGDAGAFSFFPTKNLGCYGDGGLVTTRDRRLAETVRKLRVHGGRTMRDHDRVGLNSRLDALQAAVLRAKLPHLAGWTETRGENARLYSEILAGVDGIQTPRRAEGNVHVHNQYTLRVHRRDELRDFLEERGIGSAVYYPVPLHLQPCFSEFGYGVGDLPAAEKLSREVVSLPIFPELGEERIRKVGEVIREFYQ